MLEGSTTHLLANRRAMCNRKKREAIVRVRAMLAAAAPIPLEEEQVFGHIWTCSSRHGPFAVEPIGPAAGSPHLNRAGVGFSRVTGVKSSLRACHGNRALACLV